MVQGALGIDEELVRGVQLAPQLARARVRGRLDMAEVALRDGTAHALDVAAAHLPRNRDVLAVR